MNSSYGLETVIPSFPREGKGKGEARKLRSEGKVPGVFYFHNQLNIPLYLNLRDVERILTTHHHLIQVEIPGLGTRRCIIREVQRHPASDKILHLDLQGVVEGEKVTVKVPIRLTGTSEGSKEGGILEQGVDEVELECEVRYIPEFLEIDISSLKLGESLYISDLKYPQYRFLEDPHTIIAHIAHPKAVGGEEKGVAPQAGIESPQGS
ncbi:MAG: 50S ribosomal protein L25 [bacterium]